MSKLKPLARFLIIAAFLVAADQISKYLARVYLNEGESLTVIPRAFDITLVYNRGIAFGFLPGAGIWLSPLALIVAILAAIGYKKAPRKERVFRAAMILLGAGALGNFADRVFNGGKVTDILDIKIIHVFNIADACITVAAVLLVVHWLFEIKKEKGQSLAGPAP